MAARSPSFRSACTTLASTSERTERKLPKLTYTYGSSLEASQASTSGSAGSSRTADPRKACGGRAAVRLGSKSSAG